MIVEFLPQAKSELLHAVEYYEGQLIGLGQRFWNEVDQHITWIVENPEVPQLRAGGLSARKFASISVLCRLYCSRSNNLGPVHRTRSQPS